MTLSDKEFLAVIARVAEHRREVSATGLDVTHLFKPIFEKYTLVDFENYLKAKYASRPNEGFYRDDGSPKSQSVMIQGRELRKLDRRFLYDDGLRILFRYTDGCSRITSFHSHVENGNMIGHPSFYVLLFPFAAGYWVFRQTKRLLTASR